MNLPFINLSMLFRPECDSNVSILSSGESAWCMRMNWFLFVTVVVASVGLLYLYRTAELNEIQVSILIIIGILVIGQISYLVGKRKKESQQIDEKRLKTAGLSKNQAKLYSFMEQSLTGSSNSAVQQL